MSSNPQWMPDVPPPPQPAPNTVQSYPSQQTGPYGQQNPRNHRGGRGGHRRDRGRGNGFRGGRGGHFAGSENSSYLANTQPVNSGYHQMNHSGYQAHVLPNSPSRFNPSGPPHFSPAQSQSAFLSTQSYSPQTPGFNASVGPPSAGNPPNPHAPATLMGPPIRWGFGSQDDSTAPYNPHEIRGGRQHQSHHPRSAHQPYPPSSFSGSDKTSKHGNKRAHSAAFNKPQNVVAKTAAAPSVPSFGNPLPVKPPTPVDAMKKPNKKKRKQNQLGLTPKADEHESSEEEEEIDEEEKLAKTAQSDHLKFTYKGQTSTLQTPSDIVAWIEERKKKFPTKQRVAERKKEMEEKKTQREAQRLKAAANQASRRVNKDSHKKEREKQESKGQTEHVDDPQDAAARAEMKADKLRRRLQKEEKRVAKAEADAQKARLRLEALQQGIKKQAAGQSEPETKEHEVRPSQATDTPGNLGSDAMDTNETHDGKSSVEAPGIPAFDKSEQPAVPKAPTGESGPAVTVTQAESSEVTMGIVADNVQAATGNFLLASKVADIESERTLSGSPELSDTSDETSSSGSDSSSEDDDDDDDDEDDDDKEEADDDSAPEEMSTKRDGPERVAAPPRATKQIPCRYFQRSGKCRRGDDCNFSHDLSVRDQKKHKPQKQTQEQRKSLAQVLHAREQEDADRRMLEAIMHLGSQGYFEDTPTTVPETVPEAVPEEQTDAVAESIGPDEKHPTTGDEVDENPISQESPRVHG